MFPTVQVLPPVISLPGEPIAQPLVNMVPTSSVPQQVGGGWASEKQRGGEKERGQRGSCIHGSLGS